MEASTTEESRLSKEGLPESLCSLRNKLYCKAKREPRFRFYTLYGHMYRDDVLEAAWKRVKRGGKSPGIDGVTTGDIVRADGVEALLRGIQEDLKARTYRPQPVLRTYIPKADGGLRPLGIPTDASYCTSCNVPLGCAFLCNPWRGF